MRKTQPTHAEATPPDWFCYCWAHIRRNSQYRVTFHLLCQLQAAKSLGPAGAMISDPENERLLRENEEWEKEAFVAIGEAGLPVPIDPKLDAKQAWQVVKEASSSGNPSGVIRPSLDQRNPHHPAFAPVQWKHSPDESGDATQNYFLGEFRKLVDKWEHAESTDEQTKARHELGDFLNVYLDQFDYRVNTSLPVATIRRQFGTALKEIIKLRKQVGLKQSVERWKPKWKEHLQIWDSVHKSSRAREPKFETKFLKKIFPNKVSKLTVAVRRARESQQQYKKGIDKLRSQTEHAYRVADQRIAESFRE